MTVGQALKRLFAGARKSRQAAPAPLTVAFDDYLEDTDLWDDLGPADLTRLYDLGDAE